MPELPEIETLKRHLTPLILNKKLTGVLFSAHGKLRYPFNFQEKDLLAKQVTQITRHGKNLIISLQDWHLLINLGLTGNLQIRTSAPFKHDHLTLIFDHQLQLALHDPRRFGYCLAYNQEQPPVLTGVDAKVRRCL